MLFYYGTGQSGWSRKGGSDLVVMNEVALAKHKTRETKRKDLKKAIEEAEKDIKTKKFLDLFRCRCKFLVNIVILSIKSFASIFASIVLKYGGGDTANKETKKFP